MADDLEGVAGLRPGGGAGGLLIASGANHGIDPRVDVSDPAIGYRVWSLTDDGRLMSPFARVPLPADGVVRAPRCGLIQIAELGVSYWASRDDALHAAKVLRLPVVTEGEISAPSMPDSRAGLYRFGESYLSLPPARRTVAYRVTAVYIRSAAVPAANR